MSPELTSDLEVKELAGKKYVRIDDNLVWDRPAPGHDNIVLMNQMPVRRDEVSGKILANDAGYITVMDLKLHFTTDTYQLQLEGDQETENEKTNQIARDILGVDKVY